MVSSAAVVSLAAVVAVVLVVAAGGERQRDDDRGQQNELSSHGNLLGVSLDLDLPPNVDTGESAPRDCSPPNNLPDPAGRTQLRMIQAPSDEALVAGLAAGDAETATAFVRRFQARVFGLA